MQQNSCRSLTCKFLQYMLILNFIKLLSRSGSELFTQKHHYSFFCFYFGSWLNGLAACNCCNDLVAKVVWFLPFRNCLKLLNPLSRVIERLYSFSVSYRSKAVLSSSPYEKYDQLWQYHDVSYGKRPHSHLADSSPNEMEIS